MVECSKEAYHMPKPISALIVVLCFAAVTVCAASGQDAKDVKRSKLPCKLIYRQYEAKRQFDIKLLGAQATASSEPVALTKIDENDAQSYAGICTRCASNSTPQT